MLYKTKGIIIHYLPYRETSIIAKVYTESFGIQTYIENGVRSSRGKNRMALFQVGSLLDLVVYRNPKKDIQRISEIKSAHPFKTLPYDIRKSSITLFIIEILYKTLKEEAENEPLFAFLWETFVQLDDATTGYENDHLRFLIRYAFYMGFGPQTAAEIGRQFQEYDLPVKLSPANETAIDRLIADEPVTLTRTERNELLNILLLFYRLHIENLHEVKSLTVLREVMGE